jgi:hypothetical protein
MRDDQEHIGFEPVVGPACLFDLGGCLGWSLGSVTLRRRPQRQH